MYKWYQVLVQDLDENLNENLDEDLDKNLAWLTQKTEDPKSNKGNLTFLTHSVNVIELNCKVLNKPSLFQIYSPFLVKISYPPSDAIFGRFYPSFEKVEVGVSNYDDTMSWLNFTKKHIWLKFVDEKTFR